jgi:hypothetical protein
MPYNFSDEIAGRLAGLSADPSLLDEVRVARFLLQENISNPGLANNLLTTIAKLTAANLASDEKLMRLIPASVALVLARGIVSAVHARLEEFAVPNRETLVDLLIADVESLFVQIKNRRLLTDTRKTLELTSEE